MLEFFFASRFQNIFGFERHSGNDNWVRQQVDKKLEKLAREIDLALDKAREIWEEEFKGILWFYSVRQANADCVRAADVFSLAKLLAEESGIKVEKSYRDEIRNNVTVTA